MREGENHGSQPCKFRQAREDPLPRPQDQTPRCERRIKIPLRRLRFDRRATRATGDSQPGPDAARRGDIVFAELQVCMRSCTHVLLTNPLASACFPWAQAICFQNEQPSRLLTPASHPTRQPSDHTNSTTVSTINPEPQLWSNSTTPRPRRRKNSPSLRTWEVPSSRPRGSCCQVSSHFFPVERTRTPPNP